MPTPQLNYLQALFSSSPDGVAFFTPDGCVQAVNTAFLELLGHHEQNVVGQDIHQLVAKTYWQKKHQSLIRAAVKKGQEVTQHMTIAGHGGLEVPALVTAVPVHQGQQIEGVCTIYRDMQAYDQSIARINQSETQLYAVISNAPIMLFTLDMSGRFTLTDGRALQRLELRPGQLNGQSIFDVFPESEQFLDQVNAALEGDYCKAHLELKASTFEVQLMPVSDYDGTISQVIGVGYDVTKAVQARIQLEHMAEHDVLTGLPNRSLFQRRVNNAMVRSKKTGSQMAIMFIDLDNFKQVNDTFGHAVGDELLKVVSARLTHSVRGTDTVARLGGDEFAIILEELKHTKASETVAKKILAVLSKPLKHGNIVLDTAASIGVSLYPQDGDSAERLLSSADLAMYAAKEHGNRYQFYSTGMRSEVREQTQWAEQLALAINNDELQLYYQPIIDLAEHQLTGFEALLRWRHPSRGVIPPSRFLPLAVKAGLMEQLDRWVIRQVCQQIKRWQEQQLNFHHVSINLSAQQFRNPELARYTRHQLEYAGISGQALVFEVTEEALFSDPNEVEDILNNFADMHIATAIDDFGTGYSSLLHLRDYAVDYLKIDQSFTAGLPDDPRACAVVRAILAMANSLQLEVIAEGVESQEQLAFLQAAGCQQAQGFYIYHPLPVEQAQHRLLGPLAE